RSRAMVEVGAWRDIEREPPVAVVLVQAVSTGEKMDFTIQKAVELGAAAIQPVLAARSVVRLGAARAEAKLEHWRGIAVAACEQCGRNRVPRILRPLPLAAYCADPSEVVLRLLLSPVARRSLRDAARDVSGPVAIAAGPEAGFGVEEEAMLAAAGFEPVRLGPRVLRTETAALAALAALNLLAGEG
ncbi:MAG: 16S rRNA (uracil(1498)-N(3))-methyltransferase, partial [Burkholderiales bacterium]